MSGFPQPSIVPANGYGITGNTGLTPTPAVGLTTVESFIASPVAGTGATQQVTSLALPAGTFIITGMADYNNGGTLTENVELFIGPNSASVTGAYGGAEASAEGSVQGSDSRRSLSFTKKVTLAAPTTVYLNSSAIGTTSSFLAVSAALSIPNVTGLLALRIA